MTVRDFYLEKIDKDINKHIKKIYKFCKEKNLKLSYLDYYSFKTNEKQFVPDCFSHFIGGGFPKEFFCNSKSFQRFYFTLPKDFRNEIMEEYELSKHQRMILINPKLEKLIREKLKKDYVYK